MEGGRIMSDTMVDTLELSINFIVEIDEKEASKYINEGKPTKEGKKLFIKEALKIAKTSEQYKYLLGNTENILVDENSIRVVPLPGNPPKFVCSLSIYKFITYKDLDWEA